MIKNIFKWLKLLVKSFTFGFIQYGLITTAINSRIKPNSVVSHEMFNKATISIVGGQAIISINELKSKLIDTENLFTNIHAQRGIIFNYPLYFLYASLTF